MSAEAAPTRPAFEALSGLIVRDETPADHSQVRAVNEAAFGRPDEADLIGRLRQEQAVLASCVAEWQGRLLGHILFSRMTIEVPQRSIPAVALAPMAVMPQFQRRGIGGKLIRFGMEQLKKRGERIVIVLGHPAYYPRFGFSCDLTRNLSSPFSPAAFMALELLPGSLEGVSGKVRYADAFGV